MQSFKEIGIIISDKTSQVAESIFGHRETLAEYASRKAATFSIATDSPETYADRFPRLTLAEKDELTEFAENHFLFWSAVAHTAALLMRATV